MMSLSKLFKHFSRREKLLFTAAASTSLLLFIYSFVQIDLGLVISRSQFFYNIEKVFQQIGYFNRPLSTILYSLLLTALTAVYILFLRAAYLKKVGKKAVWATIITMTAFLTFAYNAFSYDLFNYIFDAKIITHYHLNPYMYKALDFTGDPMLGFMRWTHRVYPYGPFWLLLTVPLSFIGHNIFLLTFALFKLLAALSFIGTLYFMGRIMQKIAPEKEIQALLIFGLNPLVLMESLVSAHLDIVMIFFCIWAFYAVLEKRYLHAGASIIFSAGIKFITGFLLPVFVIIYMLQRKHKKINWNIIYSGAMLLMIAAAVIATIRSTFQPWYLLEALVFASFLGIRFYTLIPVGIISFFAMLTYVPFFYTGNWDKPIPQMLSTMYILSYVAAAAAVILYAIIYNRNIFVVFRSSGAFITTMFTKQHIRFSPFKNITYLRFNRRRKNI